MAIFADRYAYKNTDTELNWIEHLTTDQEVWGSTPYASTRNPQITLIWGFLHF